MAEDRDWLSMADAVDLIGKNAETIRTWIEKGTVRWEKLGRHWQVDLVPQRGCRICGSFMI